MVASIVVPQNLPQSVLVFQPYNEAILVKEGLDNLLGKIYCLHLLTSCNTVLPVDNEEFPILYLFLVYGSLLRVGHNTQCFLYRQVWHLTKKVQHLVHVVLLVFTDCPVLWSSIRLVYGNGELLVHFEDKAVLAFLPKLLIHSLCLFVIRLLLGFKFRRNLFNRGGSAILYWSGYLHSFGLRWHFSGLLPLR